jgi:hypothetical protein
MRRLVTILLFTAVVLLAGAAESYGRGPRLRERLGLLQREEMHLPPTSYDARRAYLNERYPKYIGGIHVRELDRFGLPPGDHGPRGNGFYATPW